MLVPEIYRCGSEIPHRLLMRENPLATLVTNGDPVPYATRLAALIDPGTPETTPLVGARIVCHMNQANPHWRALADGMPAKLMFDGPSKYVTPALYQTDPAAPTWDFVTAHVSGRLELVRDDDETLRIVHETADRLESAFGEGWDSTSSVGYFREILPGVGAFHLQIERVEAMYKLSQEKPDDVQERVIRRFEQDRDGNGRRLARLMRTLALGEASLGTPQLVRRGSPEPTPPPR